MSDFWHEVSKLNQKLIADVEQLKQENARLTQRVRELEDALKIYANHQNWYELEFGWEYAEKALKGSENLPLPTLPQEEE